MDTPHAELLFPTTTVPSADTAVAELAQFPPDRSPTPAKHASEPRAADEHDDTITVNTTAPTGISKDLISFRSSCHLYG